MAGKWIIRSRSYHITTKSYARSKQQQSGLISRVTDTVKSIVPPWLQKYFKNEDSPEGGGAALAEQTDQNCQPPPPPNGSEEGPLPLDGGDSPEPSTSNTDVPTSKTASLLQLWSPETDRTHSGPQPAQSSLKRPSFNLSVFGTSSNVPVRGQIKAKPTGAQSCGVTSTTAKHILQSLERMSSPLADARRIPAAASSPLSASMDGTNLDVSHFHAKKTHSSLNSTVLNSSQLGDSPFYPGKTMYGGAAAVRSACAHPGTPYQVPVRRQIKAKPIGTQSCGVTSTTAKHIFQSLERMSSPLADARRIPAAASSPLSASMDGTNRDVSHFCAKKKRMESTLPPVQERRALH